MKNSVYFEIYLSITALNTEIHGCRNIVEANSFRRVSDKTPENQGKLCIVYTNFPHQKISLTLCGANQWTGFYVITVSVMKESNYDSFCNKN